MQLLAAMMESYGRRKWLDVDAFNAKAWNRRVEGSKGCFFLRSHLPFFWHEVVQQGCISMKKTRHLDTTVLTLRQFVKATTDLCARWDASWVIPGEILLMADPALWMQKIASCIASHVKLILPDIPLNLE